MWAWNAENSDAALLSRGKRWLVAICSHKRGHSCGRGGQGIAHMLDPIEDGGPGSGIAGCDAVKRDSQVLICSLRLSVWPLQSGPLQESVLSYGAYGRSDGLAHVFGTGSTVSHSASHQKLRKTPQQCRPLCHTSSGEGWNASLSSPSTPGGWVARHLWAELELLFHMSKCWTTDECRLWKSWAGRPLTCESRGCRSYDPLWNARSPSSISMSQLFFLHTIKNPEVSLGVYSTVKKKKFMNNLAFDVSEVRL